MFNTFGDVFNPNENNTNKINGTNPFDLPSSSSSSAATTDPFGISTNMKLSESSEKFDDNPFLINNNTTPKEKSVRPRSGKEALSSPNWLAYQHSMDEANLDSVEDRQDTSSITQTNKVNVNNPFLISTDLNLNQSNEISSENFPTNLLFDSNTVSTTKKPINPFADPDENSSTYDPFGFNQENASLTLSSSSTAKLVENDSQIDMSKINQNKTLSSSNAQITSFQSTPTNQTTSNITSDNQFLDWFTQTDNSKTNQNTQDLFGDFNQTVQTKEENIPEPSNEDLSKENIPTISVDEPTAEHNDSNVVPPGYFDNKKIKQAKNNNNDDDSDDDNEKLTFKIGEKKANISNAMNIPVPLLPPPPSPSSLSKNSSDDGKESSSSSETENQDDDDDPLAMFRSKSIKNKTNQQQAQGKNLITDWDEDETKTNENIQESQEKRRTLQSPPSVDYYLHEPDYDDSAPLEAYHNDINELQLQQLNGWLLQIRLPLRQKDLYKSTFQRFSEQRTWQECYVRIFIDEKKVRFYLPQTIEQSFAEIELQTWYQCTKLNLQQLDQYTKIHTFKLFEANYREIPQVRLDRLVTLPEKFFRKFTRPNKAQQVLLDHANCVQQEVVKFGQLNYTYLKQFSIILDDLFWSMPVTRTRAQKHLKEEVTVKILDEYYAHIDKYRHICKHKSRTRLFLLTFLNGNEPIVEIGINDWFRHGKEVNKRNEIIINKTLQEYWIKPEQVELASIVDANEYENTHLIKLIPPDSQKIEIMRFRTRPKQNIELPLQVYCFMSVIDRQVNVRIEVTVSNAFNISILSKASSMATNDKTANIRDDNSDEQCPCEDIQIRFPIPDPWVYMFRVEKRFRYGAIHSVRRKAGKIKGLDRLMLHRNDGSTPLMAASTGIAKYEQAFRSIVWRIDQLPKRDQGAYKTHLFECKFSIPSHDPIPEKYQPLADVEYSMRQAFVSHCQIRAVAVPTSEEPPEKWIRPKSLFTYTLDIEYAFKEEEKREFAPIEIDMKEQPMSQSETENNSQSDDSD